MQIKRFEAPTMTEALRLIKKEFGPDAVILSARSLSPEKSLFGIKKKTGIEVTAAYDTLDDDMETRAIEPHAISTLAGNVSGALKGQRVSVRIDDSNGKQGMMNAVQSSFKSLSIAKNTQSVSAGPDEVFNEKFKSHFASQGVEDYFVQEILAQYIQKTGSQTQWDTQDCSLGLLKVLSEMGITVKGMANRSAQQIHAFVGPAGGGKTSAMIRLAAVYPRQFKQKIGWITFDTQRVAAVSQLQVYGKIFGVPVEPAVTVTDFKEALRRFKQMDHIFIDTPGMGVRDTEMIAELSDIMKHANASSVHLVVSASTKNEDLTWIVKAYKPLSVNSLIVSKLDESQSYGNVLNLLMRSKLPVSYFSSGQAIPQSLEKATLEKIVELILSPAKESSPRHVPPGKIAEIIHYMKNNSSQVRDNYLANHNSILFHHPECAWAKRIRPENLIVFESIEEAYSKQYIPCKTCCSHIPEIPNMAETEIHRVGNGQPYYSR